MPSVLYYQSYAQPNVGGVIRLVDRCTRFLRDKSHPGLTTFR